MMVTRRGFVYGVAVEGQLNVSIPPNLSPSAWKTPDPFPAVPAAATIVETASVVPPEGTVSSMLAVYPAVTEVGRVAL